MSHTSNTVRNSKKKHSDFLLHYVQCNTLACHFLLTVMKVMFTILLIYHWPVILHDESTKTQK